MHAEKQEGQPPQIAEADSDIVVPETLQTAQPEEEDDDSIEAIFLRAVSEIPTQPLHLLQKPAPAPTPWPVVVALYLFVLSAIGGAVVGILTYPTVTIDLVLVEKHAHLTTQLDLPTRTLAPAAITKTASQPTSGHGHQDATQATGTLTFYNGQATPQTIPAGTVLVGADGVKIATDQTLTIPPNTPPVDGQATVPAHAVLTGKRGNIPALDLNGTISGAVFVKNLNAFTGGGDARDFQSVSQSDLERIIATVRNTLTQEIPRAFALAPREVVVPTNCVFRTMADHAVGDEATEVTVKATYICKGVAYNQDELQQQATDTFTSETRPGANYRLENAVQVSVASVSPFTVSVNGLWVYMLSQEDEQFLATNIAGDSPQEAQRYLLSAGFIARATVPQQLPRDPEHIHFLVLVVDKSA